MAEEPKTNPWEPLLLLIGFVLLCLALIWARGGLSEITNEGFFVSPPAPPQTAPAPTPTTSSNPVT